MTKNTRRLLLSITLTFAAAGVWRDSVVRADPAPAVYYISMRGLQSEAAPTFVIVEAAATAQRQSAIAGCDGRTYYATSADAAAVASARSSGEVVQLHRGREGVPPQTARIMCIIDASGT